MFRVRVPVELPYVVGYDVAGIVSAVGQGVTSFRLNDRVVASVRSAYAELAVADVKSCASLPDGFDFVTAASLPCAALTGVQMIEDAVRPRQAQRVLITGATGAVGRFATHAAVALGAKVVAAVRPAYFEEAKQLGAHEVLSLEGGDPKGLPFDHVADTVGGPAVAKLCRHLAPGGSIITVSTTPIDPAGLSATPTFFAYRTEGSRLARLLEEVAAGAIDMPIARRLPLTSAAEAHRLMESGGLRGKIILEP
jgi:NADPH:quinone reductase-like Zn-dependent oxidoreductase